MTVATLAHAHNHVRRDYRHRAPDCTRLLFTGYLPAGTYIEMRCPACGRMHVIRVTTELDIEHGFDYSTSS